MTTREIHERIKSIRVPTSVWAVRGKLTCHSTGSKRHRELRDLVPGSLVGVYGPEIEFGELTEDIEAMVIRMRSGGRYGQM
jgi:hypothetical protein